MNHRVSSLLYENDVFLLASSAQGVEHKLGSWQWRVKDLRSLSICEFTSNCRME